jgi:hypothetical protein
VKGVEAVKVSTQEVKVANTKTKAANATTVTKATPWKAVMRQGLVAGSVGSALSALALLAAGRHQTGSAVPPVNAVSHWYWGDRSFHRRRTDVQHTAVGYLTHHGASVFWATLYAAATKDLEASRTPAGIAAGALATSALACFVDYQLTPKRLTPGFEHEISRPAMAGVYTAMALGLAIGAWLSVERERLRNTPSEPEELEEAGSAGHDPTS